MIFDLATSWNAGGKIQRVRITAVPSITNTQSPESLNRYEITVGVLQGAQERAVRGIKRVDPAVTEVADQKIIRERAECARRNRQSPRRVEHSIRTEALQQVSI